MLLLVSFVSLTSLQRAPCCYFPFFFIPKYRFPALDTFQHNGKNSLSYVMYSDFLWNSLSCWRKRACVCQPARRPIFQQSGTADGVLLVSETVHPDGKLALSVGRYPPEWHQSAQRSPHLPSQEISRIQHCNSLVVQLSLLSLTSPGPSTHLYVWYYVNTHINEKCLLVWL